MSVTRLLACSSSIAGNSAYLEPVFPLLKQFLPQPLSIAFIPFASTGSYDDYFSKVVTGFGVLPHRFILVTPGNAAALINEAEAIMVGGGNTFKLLHHIYEYKLLDVIRNKVEAGSPYIGWSAGANITGPSIGTTNDMPIIEPKSFNALGLLPFQINPHYNNYLPPGHNGETRDQRLVEFLAMNPGLSILALPEGSAVMKNEEGIKLMAGGGKLFEADTARELAKGADLSFLI